MYLPSFRTLQMIQQGTLKNRYILVSMLCTIVLACGCKADKTGPVKTKQPRQVMGTLAELTVIAPDEKTADLALKAGYDAIDRVETVMSAFKPESDIGRLNRQETGKPITVSPETLEVIEASFRFSELSDGALDITCRPLLCLWKSSMKKNRVPREQDLKEARDKVSWTKLGIDKKAGTVLKKTDGMNIDLGAIAKGYALDLAARAMKKAGATAGVVNVGGDVLTFGKSLDTPHWFVGIQHPFEDTLLETLIIDDCAVATSGVQHRFYKIDGVRYSHIIDPRTGQPAKEAPSVTVIAPDGMTADALATVFSVLSVEEGQKLARTLENVHVFWIWGDPDKPQKAHTENFSQYIAP